MDTLATRAFHRQRRAWGGAWAILGHTRFGTRGKNVERNAHPFCYGDVVGAHNGVVDSPVTYEVDSQYIFDRLAQCGGDYQSAIGNLSGSWGLWWHRAGAVYLQAHKQTLARAQHCGAVYFSSDAQHLRAALAMVGRPKVHQFECGETISVSPDGHISRLPALVDRSPPVIGYAARRNWWSASDIAGDYAHTHRADVHYLPAKYRQGLESASPFDLESAQEYSEAELCEMYDRFLDCNINAREAAALCDYGWVDADDLDELARLGGIDRSWEDHCDPERGNTYDDTAIDDEDALWSEHINRD